MNKSILKLFPAALAIVALSSCNTDDQWTLGADSKLEGRSLIVETIDPMADGNITRASMNSTNARFFNTNDKLRAYDANLQAYDLYTSKEGNVFTADAGDEIAVQEPKNMLFPADMVEYGSWKPETKKFALMKLAMYEGAEDKTDGTLYYSEETTDGATAYISNLPEFGKISTLEPNLKATAVYLTGYLKIKIENGAKNVLAIRVSSLTEDGNPNTKMPLWGYFDAVLDDADMDVTKNTSRFQVSTEKLAAASEEEMTKRTVLTVDLGADQMKEYTSYVFIPIVPTTTYAEAVETGTYPKLKVEYLTTAEAAKSADQQTWTKLTEYENKQIKTSTPYSKDADGETMVINGFPIEKDVTSLADIQEALNEAAEIGLDITVTLNVQNAINIIFTDTPSEYTLTIPNTLNGQTVTLDCKGKTGTEAITTGDDSTGERDYDVFKIVAEEGAKGTLAIKGATVLGAIDANVGDVDLELSYGTYGKEKKKLDFTTNNLTLDNVTFKATPTLGSANVTVNGKVVLPEDAELATTGDVVVNDKTNGIEAKISATNVTVNGKAADITATGAVTVNEGAKVTGDVEAATATIEGEVKNLTVTTSAEVNNAKVETITTTTGNITINNVEEDGKLEKEISEIKLLGAATLNLNNGFVKKITSENEGTATAATIVSKGKSAIKEVTNASAATITSYWDGKTHTGFNSNNGVYKDYATTAIYTASQLATPNGSSTLYADIYLNTDETDYKWNGISRNNSNFNGNNHTIYNVKLSETAKGFINSASATNNDRSITNLTIDGFTAEGTLVETGALVGTASANSGKSLTISGVEVKNASIKGDDESHDLGGLIGKVSQGTINITKDVKVSATVEGYYNLGVLIGSTAGDVEIAKNGPVSITKDSKLNVVKTYAADEVYDENAGKAGYVVGQILEDGSLSLYSNSGQFGNGVTAASVDPINDLHYDLCRLTANKKDYYFRGCLAGGGTFQYFVGFSPEAGEDAYKKKVTTNDIKQTNCYNGEDEAPNMEVTKNAFNVFKTTKQ